MPTKYEQRGVSAKKEDVHAAVKNLDKGLYPNAFCKILPDLIGGDPAYCNIMHADTAGTKTALAYLYWKETGDLSVWEGIVQDAIVMNLDDMACTGAVDRFILSNTIGRNKNHVTGDVIATLINATQKFINKINRFGFEINLAGGETADVGDIVSTADVGFTAFSRFKRANVIEVNIQPGDVLVSLASDGKASYEDSFNSGIGSNGLTLARHETLSNTYAEKYPESFDPSLNRQFVYTGKQLLTDATTIENFDVGKLLLSPTRTYLPVIREVISKIDHQYIHGIIHNTGGGQTKILHFIDNLKVVKQPLYETPEVFRLIQSQSNIDWKEMYQVFNMGRRLEFYVQKTAAQEIIDISHSFNIDAEIMGFVEKSDKKEVVIKSQYGEFRYS